MSAGVERVEGEGMKVRSSLSGCVEYWNGRKTSGRVEEIQTMSKNLRALAFGHGDAFLVNVKQRWMGC